MTNIKLVKHTKSPSHGVIAQKQYDMLKNIPIKHMKIPISIDKYPLKC